MRVTIVTNIHLATTYRGGGWWCALLIPRFEFKLTLKLKSARRGWIVYATAFCPAISPREG